MNNKKKQPAPICLKNLANRNKDVIDVLHRKQLKQVGFMTISTFCLSNITTKI